MKDIFFKYNIFQLWKIIIVCSIIVFVPTLSSDRIIDEEVRITRGVPIPKESYLSWSLFLINNPEWLLPESNNKIEMLYDRFKAFGWAIGPDHLAVWFWKQIPDSLFYMYVDVARSSVFCKNLNLKPSNGPIILVTTEYPGAGLLSDPETFFESKDFATFELNGKDASEIMHLLTALTDQLVVEGMPQTEPKSEGFWRTIERAYEIIRDEAVEFSKNVKFSINTNFFKIEIDTNEG